MTREMDLRRGFTLVELLVVITIIGILAGLITVNLNTARAKARDDKRRSDLQTVATSLEVYRSQTKRYPIWTNGFSQPGGWDSLKTVLVPDYLSNLPQDPKNRSAAYGSTQGYLYATNRESLTIPNGMTNRAAGGLFALDAALEQNNQTMTIDSTIVPTDNGNQLFFQTGYYSDPTNSKVIHYRVAG